MTSRILPVLPLAAAGMLAALLTGCGGESSAKVATPAAQPAPGLELAPADVATVQSGTLQASVAITGQLQPQEHTTVQAQVGANVAKVLVREGEAVKAGQVLAQLATQDLDARLRQAEAALASARAEAVLARAVQERNEELHKQQYVSEIDYKRGAAEASARAENVKAQEALVAIARKAVKDAVVTAPMSGIIAQRQVEPGQTVAMNAPLFEIVDLSALELTATIPAEHVGALKPGQQVAFTVQGFAETFTGTVSRVNPVAETGTRAVTFYARVANPQQKLKAGLFVQGRLQVGQAEEGLLVPTAAIHRDDGQAPYVWVLADHKLVKRAVTPGAADAASGKIRVADGLQAGDVVVLARLSPQAANLPVTMTTE